MRAAFVVGLLGGVLGAAGPADLERCISKPAGAERIECLQPIYEAAAPGKAEIGFLERLLAQDPTSVERLSAVAEATLSRASSEGSERTRAQLHDLRGQSLELLSRSSDAADAFLAALALDEGTTRLTWTGEDGRVAWTAALDPGDGRLVRAAQSYLKAGRKDAARTALAHALAAGALGWAKEGWAELGGGTAPGLDPSPGALTAGTWFPPAPDVEVKLHDGGSFRLASARGKVVILDFWASWCAPCLEELPHLQALANAEKDLVVLAINARESVQAARSTFQALSLTLPVAFYDTALDTAFGVRAIPTVILIDREGRLRTRWDQYVPDFDGEIGARVKKFLGADPEDSPRKVADVLAGGGLLRIRWQREIARAIDGLAVVADERGQPRIAVTAGEQLLLLRSDGKIEERRPLRSDSAGELLQVESSSESRFDLVSFRPGGKELSWIDSRSGVTHAWSASDPILDLDTLPASPPASSRPRLVLAGLGGVRATDVSGEEVAWKEATGEVFSVARTGSGGSSRIAALHRDGTLLTLDATGHVVARRNAPTGSHSLLVAGDGSSGVGFLPSRSVSVASGRILGAERLQAALASEAGQLVIVDLMTGAIPFRALWPGISHLAAADLDGDGKDELIVAGGKMLAVLGHGP